MSDEKHMFTLADDRYVPAERAFGRWGPDMLNGPAVCAAAAHALEIRHGSEDFVPARTTIDMFKAARGVPLVPVSRVVREGRRIRVAEVDLQQDDVVVARATMVALRTSEPPSGQEWQSQHPFDPPASDEHRRWFGSDDRGWTTHMSEHQNASRKRLWSTVIPVVAGEEPSPYVQVVMAAESTSLVTNWGSEGIGYINCDLTVAISRLPEGSRIGLQADTHITAAGLSVGTATLFDARGPIGTGVVTAVANPAAQIDFSRGVPAR
ncbi:acyl-CoA thioesterase domain-containing protein [Williamsia deligens]|uniref:Acyl-CoA thioesterase domain-containing protein n=1 Tax=Williamsia deligens TaxID=321325 RepID=A0ABW3G8P9_9NOCA|nr:acyl-CoA thioesterase domain-containing protein [Williamsia deligens]MCP2194140.1 Thioesterase-like superfamily protein [Williamsia deligens]